jgi:hypothetical protein
MKRSTFMGIAAVIGIASGVGLLASPDALLGAFG